MHLLDALQVFQRVAELSSFSAAAEQLGLSKGRVSGAVAQLEDALGVRLLHRTTRRVQLTEDGRVAFERGRELVSEFDELVGHFRSDSADLRGRLRVDMPQAVACDVVLPRLPEFLAAHPRLEVDLCSVDRRVDLVREGFDCVLRVGAIGDPSLVVRPLGQYAMANCASPDYLRRFGMPQTLEELAGHRLIHYQPSAGAGPDSFEHVDAQGQPQQIAMPAAVTVNATFAYQAACLAGLGIIQVPRLGVYEHLQSGRLVELLPRHTAAPMPVSLVYAHRRHQPRRVRVFMQWLEGLMRERLDVASG
jgi:DNA-binding transcriptional LysR family regulator